MVQSQLSAYSGSDPIWGFVALVGSELFTGEADVGLDPRVRLFAVEGQIYFAEREDDAPVATRLVKCGAISTMQLARGAVQAAGQQSLARLFQRDATVDRDAVELTIATSTESLLASIAHNPVGMPEVFPLRYHPSGIHHWLRDTHAVVVEDAVADDVGKAEVTDAVVHVEEVPVVELPVAEIPVAEIPVAEIPVTEAPVQEALVAEAPAAPVLEVPVATPEPLTLPILEAYPAPKPHAEPAVPEWPRVDDEPAWAVPPDATEALKMAAPVAAEPVVASAVVPITAAHLPHLAPLSSFQIQPTPTDFFEPTTSENLEPPVPVESVPAASAPRAMGAPSLPKLAAGPMSVKDLKKDLQMAAAATEPWNSTSNNMAAVQIWEMVDDLFEDPKQESVRVGSGAPQVRSRRWLRKKS